MCLLKLASGKKIRTTKLMADLGSNWGSTKSMSRVLCVSCIAQSYSSTPLIDKICRLTALWKSLDPKELLDQLRKGGYRYWGKVR